MGNVLSIYQQSYSHSGSDYFTQIDQEEVLLQGAGGMYNPDGRTVEYKIAGSSGPATVTTAVLSGGGNYQEQLINLSGTTITLNSGSNTYDYSNYTAERTTNEKQFELPNHLGSVVTVTSDRKRAYDDGTPDGTVDRYLAEINSWSDTYAFGSVATGGVLLGSEYRYGFQGIEKGPEVSTGVYEADFRMVDVRIGRWFSPDPIKKHWESPYACFKNNPVYYVDPSGLDPTNGQATPTGGGNQPKTGDTRTTRNQSGYESTEEYTEGVGWHLPDTDISTGTPGTNSNSGQSKDSYRKSGYNDSPYTIQRSGNSLPLGRLSGINTHWTISFKDVSEGFLKRLGSNLTLGATSIAAPVYNDTDDAATRRSKAVGALLADVLSIQIGTAETLGGIGGELVTAGLGSAVFLPVIAHGVGVIGKSVIAIPTDIQMLFSVDAVVTDSYHEGSDEGVHSESSTNNNGDEFADILDGATQEKNSSSRIFSKNGGKAQAQSDFDSKVTNMVKNEKGLQIGKDAKGNTYILRSKSTDGRETLEIQPAKGRVIKIRYNE